MFCYVCCGWLCNPLRFAVKYSRGCKYTGHDKSMAMTNPNYFLLLFTLFTATHNEITISFLKMQRLPFLWQLRWAAACLQGNPDIPFQINLNSSAFINRAHGGGFILSSRGKKDTGQNVNPLKTVLHCVPLEIMTGLFPCLTNIRCSNTIFLFSIPILKPELAYR